MIDFGLQVFFATDGSVEVFSGRHDIHGAQGVFADAVKHRFVFLQFVAHKAHPAHIAFKLNFSGEENEDNGDQKYPPPEVSLIFKLR